MIPKIIHRVWLGPKEMPENFLQYGLTWQHMNPYWEVIEWDEKSLYSHFGKFRCQSTIDLIVERSSGPSVERSTQLADIIGHELTYEFGGIYMNCDVKPIRPLGVLFAKYPQCLDSAFASSEFGGFVVNAVTGGPAKHPFWEAVLEALPGRYASYPPGTEMVWTTGPRLLTDLANYRKDCYALPEHVFNPVPWQSIPLGSSPDGTVDESTFPEDVVAMHAWAHRKSMRSNIVP